MPLDRQHQRPHRGQRLQAKVRTGLNALGVPSKLAEDDQEAGNLDKSVEQVSMVLVSHHGLSQSVP